MDPETAVINGIEPRQLIAPGGTVQVFASAKKPFIVKRCQAGHYSCTCLSFQGGAGPVNARSCSHLKKTLGAEYEDARIKLSGRPGGDNAALTAAIMKKRRNDPHDFNLMSDAQKAAGSSNGFRRADGGQGFETDWQGHETFNGRAIPKDFDRDNAIGIMQSEAWDKDLDPKGWWLSEKLDGVRAYWTGEKLISRTNRDWKPPQWFLDKLPKGFALDGELWRERDGFEDLGGICARADKAGWCTVNYFVFDAPDVAGGFEQRMAAAKKRLPDGEMTPDQALRGKFGGRIAALPQVVCQGQQHLDSFVDGIIKLGGEGGMLRRRNSPYERRRSFHSRKVKRWDDGEGVVIDFNRGPGTGPASGRRIESLMLRMASGVIFDVGVGMTEAMHNGQNLPEKGTLVRYRCQGLTMENIPRFPVYEGVCYDRDYPTDPKVETTELRKRRREDDDAAREVVAKQLKLLEAQIGADKLRARLKAGQIRFDEDGLKLAEGVAGMTLAEGVAVGM